MITEALFAKVAARMSNKRFVHTLGVLKMARTIAVFCLPTEEERLSYAALLHDITKELTEDEQLSILEERGFPLNDEDRLSPQVLHSFSAQYVIENEFSEYSSPDVLSAVTNHTLGAENMSVFDEIIFISDYIEEGRTYDSCIKTREFLLGGLRDGCIEDNIILLHKSCKMAIEFTIANLTDKNKCVNTRTILALESLNRKINLV